MERKDSIDALGATFLVVFSAMLGLNQALVVLVNVGLAPVFQAGLRSAVALVPVLIYAGLAGKKLSISDGTLVPGLIVGVFFATEFMLLFQAVEFTSVARASVFFYTMPIWVAIASHFLFPDERLTGIRTLGLGLAILGILVAIADRTPDPNHPASWFGDMLALCATFGWVGIALIARTTSLRKASPEMALLYQLAVSAPLLLLVAPLFGDLVRDVTPVIIGIFLFQAFGIVAIGFLGWFWVLSIYPTSDMASFSFLAPIFGVLFGWLILDESISINILLALLLVAIGIFLVNKRKKA